MSCSLRERKIIILCTATLVRARGEERGKIAPSIFGRLLCHLLNPPLEKPNSISKSF